ncbi:hypothetical protein ABPG72_007795 [Tetrahymena utriculariae]
MTSMYLLTNHSLYLLIQQKQNRFQLRMLIFQKIRKPIQIQKQKFLSPFKLGMNMSQLKDLNINITQSQNDKASYRIVQLIKNQLDCLLISDQEADKSACSMDVQVGNLEDPIEYQGLAHFCEHMLFLGTEKYPIESEYKSYLNKHAGTQNASTGPINTVYHFSCANGEAYEGALDRFSQFFTAPLFTESCTQREINAIENENKKNFNSDSRRIYQIHRHTCKQGNVYNKFGTGNLETLNKPNVREYLIEFHKKYYSANQMKLVLYSNETLQKLEELAAKYFENIPNSSIQALSYKEMPFGKEELAKYIKMVPVSESHQLQLGWIVDYHQNSYKQKSLEYLSHLFGHEGKNSLLSLLIDENLVYELSSGISDYLKLFSELYVEITLTPYGQNNIDKVLNIVAKYIQIIKTTPVEKWIWDEMKQIKQFTFQFKERQNPVNQAVLLSRKMGEYPYEDILSSSYIMEQYNEEEIKKYLSQITVENLRISNLSKTLQSDCPLIEPVYGTAYNIEDINQQIRDIFENPSIDFKKSHKVLGLPEKNPFLPKQLVQLPTEDEFLIEPKIILENDKTRVWFKQDNKFKTPKGEIELHIYWKQENEHLNGVQNQVLQKIYIQLFKDRIREMQYLASQANIIDQRSASDIYYKYKVNGFSDSIPVYTRHFLQMLLDFHENPPYINPEEKSAFEEKFKMFIQKKEIALKNYTLQAPYQTVSNHLHSLIDYDYNCIADQLDFIQQTPIDKIIKLYKYYHEHNLDSIRFEWSFIGNFDKQESISLAEEVEKLFFENQVETKRCVLPKEEIFYGRTVQIQKDKPVIFEKIQTEDQINSAYYAAFQFYDQKLEQRSQEAKHLIFKTSNLLRVLHNILKQPAFSQLRTKEQLGYIVQAGIQTTHKISSITFLIQSSTKSPEYLSSRIQVFLESMKQTIQDLSEEDFKKFIESIRTQYKQKFLNIYEEARYFNDIIEGQLDYFDILDRLIADLDTIQKQDIIDLFNHLFFNEKRLIEIHLVSPNHQEEQSKLLNERKEQDVNLTVTNSYEYTQKLLKLFPSFTYFK